MYVSTALCLKFDWQSLSFSAAFSASTLFINSDMTASKFKTCTWQKHEKCTAKTKTKTRSDVNENAKMLRRKSFRHLLRIRRVARAMFPAPHVAPKQLQLNLSPFAFFYCKLLNIYYTIYGFFIRRPNAPHIAAN